MKVVFSFLGDRSRLNAVRIELDVLPRVGERVIVPVPDEIKDDEYYANARILTRKVHSVTHYPLGDEMIKEPFAVVIVVSKDAEL